MVHNSNYNAPPILIMKILKPIEIRYHQPVFAKEEVIDYFRLEKWPRNFKHSVGWEEIRDLANRNLRFRPKKIGDLSYLCWVLSPEFHFSRGGLYLTDMGNAVAYKDEVNKHGKFNTEGLINHIHLDHVIKNRIAQFEIGVRAIRAWVPALQQIAGLKRASIYLNGPDDYTLCLYGNPADEDLKSLDQRISQDVGELTVKKAESFIRWSLE